MHTTKRSTVSLTLMVVLVGATLSVAVFATSMTPSPAAATSFNGKIAFSSSRDGNFEIYVMDGDGTNEERLTNNTANDRAPSWSPNGTRIAFARDNAIHMMDPDGRNMKRVLGFAQPPEEPAWSPDGKSILFSAGSGRTDRDIYIVKADGGRAKEITKNATSDDFEASWSPDGKKIAFSSTANGTDYDIYVMDADGSNRTLIASEGSNRHPSWSPDGTKIVFSSNRVRTFDIFVMDTDGGNVTRLTDNGSAESYPSWSPDGTKIVFAISGGSNGDQVYLMNADGSKQQRLTRNQYTDVSPIFQPLPANAKEDLPILRENGRILFETDRQGNSAEIYVMNMDGSNSSGLIYSVDSEDSFPKWSPDGNEIAYVSTTDGREEIVVVTADGSNRTSVTASAAPLTGLGWSPDGEKLVFAKGDPNHRWIHIINSDGTDLTRLTTFDEPDTDPCWSPDGEWIAFSRNVGGGNSEIYVMKKDGSGQKKITNHHAADRYPRWSPEGDQIAFVTNRDGNEEIYVMSPDGKKLRNLTNNTADDLYPSWSPDGTSIAFASDRLGDGLDIQLMNADGKNVVRLTNDESSESYPDFGPLIVTTNASSEPPKQQEIQSVGPPLTILTPVLKSESSSVHDVAVGDNLVVATNLTNTNLNATWQSVAILQVTDWNGITRHLDLVEFTVLPGGQLELNFRWTPEEAGTYDILVFVIGNAQDPEILADKAGSRITIQESN